MNVITPEQRALFERAIADPTSITPAEKNTILGLPHPDEENRLHQSTFNLSSREALVTKALPDDGGQLSEREANWLSRLGLTNNPFVEESYTDVSNRVESWFGMPVADSELVANAQDAVYTPDEKKASIHAHHQVMRLGDKKKRANDERRAYLRELRSQPRTKWVRDIMDAAIPRWGFVVLRTAYSSDGENCSDEAWQRFQDYFRQTGKFAMRGWNGGLDLWPIHESTFVSDREALEGADTATLRARMRTMRQAGQIPDGVREDVFLVADKKVFCNDQFSRAMPYYRDRDPKGTVSMRAVDPDHDASAQPAAIEATYPVYDGEITVPLPKVFDWLHYTFFAGTESWLVRHREKTTRDWAPSLQPYSPYPGYTLRNTG